MQKIIKLACATLLLCHNQALSADPQRAPAPNNLLDFVSTFIQKAPETTAEKITRLEKQRATITDERERERLDKERDHLYRIEEESYRNGSQLLQTMAQVAAAIEQSQLKITEIKAKGEMEERQIAIQAGINNRGMLERLEFMSKPENLKSFALFLTASTIGVVGGYHLLGIGRTYVESKLEKTPELVDKTSRVGIVEGWKKGVSASLYGPPPVPTFEETIVFNPTLQKQMAQIADMAKVCHEKSLSHPNLLLYGPPGTGKTLYAKWLATSSGMDYAIIKASKFATFAPGKDIDALHELFDWAERSPRGTIIFIDEIDVLGKHRNKLEERFVRLLNAFLPLTGDTSHQILLAGATNRLEDLDPAFLDRFSKKIHIGLPEAPERERILNLYLDQHIINPKPYTNQRNVVITPEAIAVGHDLTADVIKQTATDLEGFSARQISKLVKEEMRNQCILISSHLTRQIFTQVVQTAIEQEKGQRQAVAVNG